MKINTRQDTSFLFNSLNTGKYTAPTGVNALAGLVSDYNTIRNGSYNKLVKAYYAKMGEDDSAAKTAGEKQTAKAETKAATAAREYNGIAKDASKLKSATEALSEDAKVNLFEDKGEGADREKINGAVSDFVDSYNSLIKSAGSSGNSTARSRAEMMVGLSVNYGMKLAGIGITVNENGSLSLDKEKLAAASTDSVKALFNGRNSFADRVDASAKVIESGAQKAAQSGSTYSASGSGVPDVTSVWNSLV